MAPNFTIFGPKSLQRRDLFFEKNSNERKNEQTNEKTERTNENRIVQVVVIVGGVSGRREERRHQRRWAPDRSLLLKSALRRNHLGHPKALG